MMGNTSSKNIQDVQNSRLRFSKIDTAQHVANYFLDKSWAKVRDGKNEFDIGTIKLNKLVFIAFGFVYHFCNRKMFDESIEAWKYGPVIPSLYHEFKHFDKSPIIESKDKPNYAGHLLVTKRDIFGRYIYPKIKEEEESKDVLNRLDFVFEKYANMKPFELVSITHIDNTPWKLTYDGSFNKAIDKDLIKKYYELLCKQNGWK